MSTLETVKETRGTLEWVSEKLPRPYREVLLVLLASVVLPALWRHYADQIPLRGLPRDPWLLGPLLLALIWSLVYLRYIYPPKPTPEGKFGIWVARIPGDVGQRRQAKYINDIDRELAQHRDLAGLVEVMDLKYPIAGDPERQRQKARAFAKRFRAAFLFRISTATRVGGAEEEEPICTVRVPLLGQEIRFDKLTGASLAKLANLDELPLSPDYARHAPLLARFAVGLAHAAHGNVEAAIGQFETLLTTPPPSHIAPPSLYFQLGNWYYELLPRGDPSVLNKAISSYQAALTAWTAENSPWE